MRMFVNDQEIEYKPNSSLLKVLLTSGIQIPTLCYHPALGADGRCGLCVVEVKRKDIWEIGLACQIKPVEGLQVRTETEQILHMRGLSAQLLLRHATFPKEETLTFLQQIIEAGDIGTSIKMSTVQTGSGCILCGLCVRACAKTGRASLTFAGKGQNLQIKSWSDRSECDRCVACIAVCPTGFMNVETKNKILVEW